METTTSCDYHRHPPPLLALGESSKINCPRKRKRSSSSSKFMNMSRNNTTPAPEITRPCTECGRKFWSWKALFGHMRCHPERQWRGIVPPPNIRTRRLEEQQEEDIITTDPSEEDHEVAAYLLMLANGPGPPTEVEEEECGGGGGRFECSSCKKVFGSHQALGGHRASHKNVKGCYAITKTSTSHDDQFDQCCDDDHQQHHSSGGRHKCSICFRVFSSGQALGGHMRCHWEKDDDTTRVFAFDLNLNPPQHDDDADAADDACVACSSPNLELRLGL